MVSDRRLHEYEISDRSFSFVTDNGVFSKTKVDEGTDIFLHVLAEENLHGSVLDMGCGYGVISIVLKKLYPDLEVSGAEVNPRAAELAEENAVNNQADIRIIVSDGFDAVQEHYDVVVTNPPIRAGKKVIYGMFSDAFDHLSSHGALYVVIRRQQGAESAVRKLDEIFHNCTILERKKGYWILKSLKLTD